MLWLFDRFSSVRILTIAIHLQDPALKFTELNDSLQKKAYYSRVLSLNLLRQF